MDSVVVEACSAALAFVWAVSLVFDCGFVSRFGIFVAIRPRIEAILKAQFSFDDALRVDWFEDGL